MKISNQSEASTQISTRQRQRLSRDVHFCKRPSRRNQRLSVTDLMALGKLRLEGNQNEGHSHPRQERWTQAPFYLEGLHAPAI